MAGSVYAGGGARVVMDSAPSVYAKVFYHGSEPERYLKRRAEAVAAAARAGAPTGTTGRLRSSIHVNQTRDEKGRFGFGFEVGTSIYYAHYVHEGTGPSFRDSSPGYMRFPGTNAYAGEIIFTRFVDHPGTPANPFLQRALGAMVVS